jgi:hypothetical protein
MASYKDLFAQAVESSLSEILGLVSRYYEEEHGVAVSAEDLMDVLGATKASSTTKTAATKTSATKTSATKTATKATTTKAGAKAAPKASKERRSREQGQLKDLCLYVLTRGANEGKYCTVRAVKGKTTCSSCKTKKGELGFYADDDGEGDEVDTGRAPGKFTGGVPNDDEDVPPLNVVPYGDSEVIYVTEDGSPTLLLVSGGEDEEDGESFTVIGQLTPKGKIVALNKLGIKRAQLLELEVNADMLTELQEKGLIDYDPDAGTTPEKASKGIKVVDDEDVDTVPGMNVDDKPAAGSKKPNLPARKTGPVAKPPPRRPAAQRAPRAAISTVEVDTEEHNTAEEE